RCGSCPRGQTARESSSSTAGSMRTVTRWVRCATCSTPAGPVSWRALRRPPRRADVGYHVVLYVHLLSVFVLVAGITMFGLCYVQLRAAGSLVDATPWARLADRTGWIFPVAILGLFAS